MSEIECAQLHNELLGCRHSTLQSHGFFALAKHLLKLLIVSLLTVIASTPGIAVYVVSALAYAGFYRGGV